jgi:hypothetical protein
MMHQQHEPNLTLDDRPDREVIIEKDEVIGLIIDLETLSADDFYATYFSAPRKKRSRK